MDDLDRQLLNRIQTDFPLTARPYAALGEGLGIDEAAVMARIDGLRREKVIRQISAIFDTRSLGYESSLVAMRVAPDHADAAGAVINEHPGVSHNYKRNHAFNIWFTIALPPGASLERTVNRLSELAGAESTRLLPTLRLFKIGVKLDMTGEASPAATSTPDYTEEKRVSAREFALTDRDIAVVRALQEDLPTEPAPFRAAAEAIGWTEDELFAHAQVMLGHGHLRRYAAILYHRNAGFRANPMAVWAVPEGQELEQGQRMASFSAVSHCYQRPVYPDWPYNVFTMIHGRTVSDCRAVIDAIAAATGINEYALLYSTKEYKKTRVRYFTAEWDEWDQKYLLTVGTPA
jgi:DNA-binding Lrp family transcriptional regulator